MVNSWKVHQIGLEHPVLPRELEEEEKCGLVLTDFDK